jgi:hypothetical protein
MKAVLFSVLALAFLVGCSDQSQLSGPVNPASGTTLAKTVTKVPVDVTIEASNGAEVKVVGSIAYDLQIKGENYVLTTWGDLSITRSDLDQPLFAVSGSTMQSTIGPMGYDYVAETMQCQAPESYAPYLLWVQYRVATNGVALGDVQLLDVFGPEAEGL